MSLEITGLIIGDDVILCFVWTNYKILSIILIPIDQRARIGSPEGVSTVAISSRGSSPLGSEGFWHRLPE